MSLEGKVTAKQKIVGEINPIKVIYTDAYKLAVQNGFDGTIEEWLDSIKGEKGDKGDSFTYDDFTPEQLEELKGADGTVSFDDLTDAQRLSLKGEKGDPGSLESTDYPGCCYRIVDGVTEWLNPPMELGVEYRTTKRMNNKVVYTFLLNCGNSPDKGSARIAMPFNFYNIISMKGYTNQTYNYIYPIDQVLTTFEIDYSGGTPYLELASDTVLNCKLFVVFEYTKD